MTGLYTGYQLEDLWGAHPHQEQYRRHGCQGSGWRQVLLGIHLSLFSLSSELSLVLTEDSFDSSAHSSSGLSLSEIFLDICCSASIRMVHNPSSSSHLVS